MGKKRCGDKDLPLLPEYNLIQVLVWLPVVSLLRFKSVCKSWRTLIESPSFTELHTKATTFNPPSKFGSFILHAAVHFQRFRESALLMLSSVSVSECVPECVSRTVSGSEYGSTWGWWSIGSNGVCGRCVSRSESGSGSSNSTISWWKTNDGLCVQCGQWSSYKVAEDDDQVFKLDTNDDDDNQQLVLKLDDLGFPSCYNFGKIRPIVMVGSCNGLICLYDEQPNEVSLWNPATRQFRILPKPITIDGDCPNHLVAFGFDAETNDYKVVLVSVYRSMFYELLAQIECLCRVQVYSLSTDTWRLLEGIHLLPGYPLPFSYPDSGLFLNGSCFFMAHFLPSKQPKCVPENDRFIISVDLAKEIIIPIQLPDHHRDQKLYLCYLGEKIALFTTACYANFDDNDTLVSNEDFKFYDNDTTAGCYEDFNIWVLNEHGSSMNKESWKRLHRFRLEHLPGERNIPRGISNDAEFALLETEGMHGLGKKKMKLYSLVTKEVKKNFLSCDQVLSKANTYKPSLVSIIGGNGRGGGC